MSAVVHQARVLTSRDPLGLGRIKVLIPQVSGDAVSAWAQPSVRTYGPGPGAGSAVWVSLDTGDASSPVYFTGPSYSPWSAPPPAWLGADIAAGSAAYRTGPGGAVQWRGALSTAVSPLPAGATLLSAIAPAPPVPVALPSVIETPSALAGTLALSSGGVLTWSAGPTAFTGAAQIHLDALAYAVI